MAGYGYGYFQGGVSIGSKLKPFFSDALFWIDGVIVEDGGNKYFRDKTTNDRKFLITDYDFDSTWQKGFPYKSAATISAPAADAELIAADINNYLYASDGTPNQLPVISLFQDVDYEHRLFCRHESQIVDANGVEVYEPRVMDVVLYSNIKADADLITCQTYYSVPVEVTENVKWVTKVGNDSTGDGSKALPWLTLIKAESSASAGDTVYVKTGIYKEATFLEQTHNIKWNGLGNCTIQSVSTNYVVFLNNSTDFGYFNGFTLDGETNTDSILYVFLYTNIINRIRTINTKEGGITLNVRSKTTLSNSVINPGFLSLYASLDLSNSILLGNNPVTASVNGSTHNFTNCNIIVNVPSSSFLANVKYNVDITIKGCKINVLDCQYFIVYGTTTTTSKLSITYSNIVITNYAVSLIAGNTSLINFVFKDNVISKSGTVGNLMGLCNANVDIQNNIFDNIYINIDKNNTVITNVIVKKNVIKINTPVCYGIAVGKEYSTSANNTVANISIENNTIYGEKYYNNLSTTTTHGIFIGFQAAQTVIRYNVVLGTGIGVVLKGSNSDYANTVLIYNVIKNSYLYGVYCKGVNNAKIYQNTVIDNAVEILASYNAGAEIDMPTGTVIKNNILYNTDGRIYAVPVNSDIDYNTIYAGDTIDDAHTQAEWIALAHDENSVFADPLLVGDIPSASSPSIGIGVDLGVALDDGLDASTNWGNESTLPVVVTKQQGAAWDTGAYIS